MKIIPNMIVTPPVTIAPPDWNPSVLNQVNLCYDPHYEVGTLLSS